MLSHYNLRSNANLGKIPATHFVNLQTHLIKIAEDLAKTKSGTFDIFNKLVTTNELFTKISQHKYGLKFNWPHENGDRDILVLATLNENKSNKLKHFTLDFYHKGLKFLTILHNEKDFIIERSLTTKARIQWSKQDIYEIASYFKQIFNNEKTIFIEEKTPITRCSFTKYEFQNFINQFKNSTISYRIQNCIINNAKQNGNLFEFDLKWLDNQNQSHLLGVHFSKSDIFFSSMNNQAGYSWFVNEDTLLTSFPEYTQYKVKPGQHYYSLKIDEVLQDLPKRQKTKTEILDLWFTLDAAYGELRHVQKGEKVNGNEVLNIYKYFDQLFRIKHTFICDVSSLSPDNGSTNIPLRLILALSTGKTWYENQLSGVKLFECKKFQTAANGKVTQNSIQRHRTLRELQQLPLIEWYTMLSAEQKMSLIELYQKYFENKTTPLRQSTRIKFYQAHKQYPLFDQTTTIQTLTSKIYQNAKMNKSITDDLIALTQLLCGKDGMDEDQPLNSRASDFWVKSRVRELLWGSLFWIKKQTVETTRNHYGYS